MPGVPIPEAERRAQLLDAALAVALRERLDGLTLRAVAAEAGVSVGLVSFHMGSKDGLLVALLDRLVVELLDPEAGPEVRRHASARDRLLALVRRETVNLTGPGRSLLELFFDYWVLGTRHPEVRERIQGLLAGYRELFLPFCADVIEEEADRFAATTPERLATTVVSFLTGTAVQTVIEPSRYDPDEIMASVEALVPPARG